MMQDLKTKAQYIMDNLKLTGKDKTMVAKEKRQYVKNVLDGHTPMIQPPKIVQAFYLEAGIILEKTSSENEFKGYEMNIWQRPSFRTWVNQRGQLTIKKQGVQKSFNIDINDVDTETFKSILKGFEII